MCKKSFIDTGMSDQEKNGKEEEVKDCIYDIIKTLYSAMITVENFKMDESQQHLYDTM